MKKLLFVLPLLLVGLYACANQPQPLVSVEVPVENAQSSKSAKAIDATKDATDKTVKATKNFTDKAVKATKKATKKSVDATKDFTNKTVDSAKDVIDNMNPNKPVTLEHLEEQAEIKTLKSERNELKSAYNSRIKDIKAKVKAAEKSTTLSDVQRQNRIYTLNKEKAELQAQRDAAIQKYNKRIETVKAEKKRRS